LVDDPGRRFALVSRARQQEDCSTRGAGYVMPSRFDIPCVLGSVSELLGTPEAAEGRAGVRAEVLRALLAPGGFERARFYETSGDVAFNDDPMLVLVATETRGPACRPQVGQYYIGGSEAADLLSRAPVSVRECSEFGGDAPRWVTELDLVDRAWVDIRLRAGGDDVGMIALDWDGSKDDISSDECKLLAGLGSMVGSYLKLRPSERVLRFRQELPTAGVADQEAPRPEDVLAAGARAIGRFMDARLVAVFEYRWSTGRLSKSHEFDIAARDTKPRPGQTLAGEEEYRAGEYLPGKAWTDEHQRHVPIFSMLHSAVNPHRPGFMPQHTEYMGEAPYTSLCGNLKGLEPRIMLRLINRTRSRGVPYVGERDVFDQMLRELRSQLERAIAMDRTRCLEEATQIHAELADPREVVKRLAPLFAREDVDDFLLLCHRPPSTQFNFGASSGEHLRGFDLRTGKAWASTTLYARATQHGAPLLLELPTMVRDGDLLAASLTGSGFQRVLVLPVIAGETNSVLVVPLRPSSPVRRDNVRSCVGAGRLGLLSAYTRVLGDAVDTAVANRKEDGARRALGLLGHELATPLARLGSTAEAALEAIHGRVVEAQAFQELGKTDAALTTLDGVRQSAQAYLDRIKHERGNVGAAIRMAPIVAQEADGRLELQFERFDLGQLVLQAIAQAEEESNGDPTNGEGGPRSTFRFLPGNGVSSLGGVVGDASLVNLALINVLLNAAKYSIPRPDDRIIEINVDGESQRGMKIILVRNTGRGISPDEMDLVFEPWVRLLGDDGKARRGMGLGLFLSRRIAYAHGGIVLCRRSVPLPEADGPRPRTNPGGDGLERMIAAATPPGARRRGSAALAEESHHALGARAQRYVTEFEVRLKDELTIGPQVHEWRSRSTAGTVRRRS
jgi:signal transduction histidine kinase